MKDITELYDLYRQHQPLTTDSRDCPEGSTFLALRGQHFDGNQYAVKALEQGCAIAIVSDESVRQTAPDELRERIIVVDDTLQTLKQLARHHRRQFDIPVLAITGTNGKTTTKELVAAVLSKKYRVLYTEGNLNNDIGVPKTLLRLTPEHQIAVVEMGASHPGDIKTLVETAEPTCGLITNVGRAHLEGFGSFEGVCRTKGELYDYIAAHDGMVFLNGADEQLRSMADERNIPQSKEKRFTYGVPPTYEEWLKGKRAKLRVYTNEYFCGPRLGLIWFYVKEPWMTIGEGVQTQLVGDYNVNNVLAAVAVGCYFDVWMSDISDALRSYRPTNSRSQLVKTDTNTLVVDAYNANPSSMEKAIETLKNMKSDLPKMAILGQMNELGSESRSEHRRVISLLAQTDITHIILIGHEFAEAWTELSAGPTDSGKQADGRQLPQDVTVCRDTDEARRWLTDHKPEGRLILIKGSNSLHLYELPQLL